MTSIIRHPDLAPGGLAPTDAQRFRDALGGVLLRLRSDKSRRGYEADWRAWIDYCDREGLACLDAKPLDVLGYAESIARSGLAESTVRRRLDSIREIYASLVNHGLLAVNPVREVRTPHVDREPNTPWLDDDELRRLLHAYDGDTSWTGRRNRLILLCLAGLGIRASELAALSWAKFRQTPAGLALTTVVKGGKRKTFGVPEMLAAELRAGIADGTLNPTGVTMWTRKGTHFSYSAVAKIVTSAAELAGLRGKATAHALRRTLATLATLGGTDLKDVQAALGHANQSTTERYIKQSRLPAKPVGDAVLGRALRDEED